MMDRVRGTNVWIGGYYVLREKDALTKEGITHVVSALREDLEYSLFEGFEHLVIPVDDVEEDNLLQHFPKSNEFISLALKKGGKVFVHCLMGISRSATLVAAYLMWSRKIDVERAVDLIRQSRPIVYPNPGFMHQLRLYQRELEKMQFRDSQAETVDVTRIAGTMENKLGIEELRCKKCRRTLATSQFLTPHIPKSAHPPSSESPNQPCSHHFLEPLQWMKPELDQGKPEGKLECPKCSSKVGSYAWQGIKCSCGDWVVPGISLARGKVDELRVQTKL